MKEAVARFRLQEDPDPNIDTYQLVKVTLEAGRGKLFNALGIFYEAFNITNLSAFLFDNTPLCYLTFAGRAIISFLIRPSNGAAKWNAYFHP